MLIQQDGVPPLTSTTTLPTAVDGAVALCVPVP